MKSVSVVDFLQIVCRISALEILLPIMDSPILNDTLTATTGTVWHPKVPPNSVIYI